MADRQQDLAFEVKRINGVSDGTEYDSNIIMGALGTLISR